MSYTALRKPFFVTYGCGCHERETLPDGPGWVAQVQQRRAAAKGRLCDRCKAKNQRQQASGFRAWEIRD